MNVLLGSNTINNCAAALVVNGEEVFRLRERQSDGQLVVDFDVRDSSDGRLAKIAKNQVVYTADGYEFHTLPKKAYVTHGAGNVIAKVEEVSRDTIKITGDFCIKGHRISITEQALVSGGVTMSGNFISGSGTAILIEPNSFAIGCA